MSERSSVAELKAACKAWGLPISGSKQVLWQRLQDQVGWVARQKNTPWRCIAGRLLLSATPPHRPPVVHPPTPCAARQVADSEEGPEGEAPQHCQVSGATRAELAGHAHKRISQSKCKVRRVGGCRRPAVAA